jgi:hypothetical protein
VKTKVIFYSLIIALVVALVMPAIVAPAPAEAAGTTMTCTPTSLTFVTYVGVPTTLLGIIPLSSQQLTLNLAGSGISGWTVTDNAAWLNENLLFGVLSSISSSTRTTKVGISVNNAGLAAGTYTATITFKITTCGTKTITVPVTLVVNEPMVLGPLCIGLDKDLTKNIQKQATFAATDAYDGITARLLVNASNVMDMQALQMNGGKWAMDIICDIANAQDGVTPVLGGNLTIEGTTSAIAGGAVLPLSAMLALAGSALPPGIANADFGNTYVIMFSTIDEAPYAAIVLGDLQKIIALVPQLGSMMSGTSASTTASTTAIDKASTNNQQMAPSTDLTIPLQPILSALPGLMPVLVDLLSNKTVLALLNPLLGAVPPVMVLMPYDTLMTLFSGLSAH